MNSEQGEVMTEYDVLNAYTRIKFHFDPKHKTTYKSVEHYPLKAVEGNKKFIDMYFAMQLNDLDKLSVFFVWLFYSRNNSLPRNNMRTLYASEEFKKFKENIFNYPVTLENEFVLAYNTKSFDSFKQLMYKGKLSSITIWILLNTRFKSKKQEILDSNVFSNIWYNINMLMMFVNVDKEIAKNYKRRIEE
jgi:hypothetical protein